MPRTLNAAKKVKTQVGATVDCCAYITRHNGTPAHSATADEILAVHLFQEFGELESWELPINQNLTSIHTPKGTEASPDRRWHTSIDGREGFNFTYTLDTSDILSVQDSSDEEDMTALELGWYRLQVLFESGAVQEFEISVRD